MSQPCSLSILATITASSARRPLPSSIQSLADMRTEIGLRSGQTPRTASKTSSG